MKVGAENRNKLYAAIGLMSLALLLVARMLFSSGPSPMPTTAVATSDLPSAPAAHVRVVSRRTSGARGSGRKLTAVSHSIDPTLRFDWLKVSEDTQYEGNGRNIFMAQAEIPQPVAPAVSDQQKMAEIPQGPPPPPPINLKFYGFASKPGEPKAIFLSQGEDIFVAREGDIVDRRYKVVHINPLSVEIEDVLTNNTQSIPLNQG
jgi:hypothetical protein